jgi:toxin ParE1/3/4
VSYKIQRSDKANDQLHEIIQYIAADSGSADIALAYLDKMERAVALLRDQPHMDAVPRYLALKRQGYRALIVERHLVFYRADDAAKTVTIHAVVDGRREYRNLI